MLGLRDTLKLCSEMLEPFTNFIVIWAGMLVSICHGLAKSSIPTL